MLVTIILSITSVIILMPLVKSLVLRFQLSQVVKKRQAQELKTKDSQKVAEALSARIQPYSEITSKLQYQDRIFNEQTKELSQIKNRLAIKVSELEFSTITALIVVLKDKIAESTQEENNLKKMAQPIYDRMAAEQRKRDEAERQRRLKREEEERVARRKRDKEEEEERQARRRRDEASAASSYSSSSSSSDSGSPWSGGGGDSSGGGSSSSW